MPRSKNIEDYFSASLNDLRPGETLSFDIHLYFPQNRHLMLWRSTGETLSIGFLEKYRAKGIETFYVHREDSDAYYRYTNPVSEEQLATEVDAAATAAMEMVPKVTAEITAALAAPELPPEEKKAQVETAAQKLVQQAVAPVTQATQATTNQQLRAAVSEILNQVLDETTDVVRSQLEDIWKLANIDPDFEHAVNVSTFAVIFAMAFGRIDGALLADLALAGLLHDIGMSQIPASIGTTPWKSFKGDDQRIYAGHVASTLDLIDSYAPGVPRRVRVLIEQHHEKFDGSGYPNRLNGFRFDDIAQLLAMADILDSFATGKWDGVRRTLKDTFTMLESLETTRTFPEHFNPDVFGAVIRWIKSGNSLKARENAISLVHKETAKVIALKKTA